MGEIFARYQDVASLKLIKKLIVTFLKVIVTILEMIVTFREVIVTFFSIIVTFTFSTRISL